MIISDQRLPVENPCLELEWSQQLLGYLQLISKVLISQIFWLVSVNFLAMTMNLLLSHVRNHIYSSQNIMGKKTKILHRYPFKG